MEKVSIIVPVYNAENYLEQGVWSLLKQSYKNCEIVLVDDGSEDNSAKIMQRFANIYGIKCIFQKNQGAGAARNAGIGAASGRYVTFMDSDDKVDVNFIQSYMDVIHKSPYVVAGGYSVSFNGGPLKGKVITKERLKIMKAPSVCFRLFNVEWLRENNLFFGNYKIGEDLNLSAKAQLLYPEYSLTTKAAYHYFVRPGSLVGTADDSQFELLDAVADIEEFAKAKDLFEQNEAELEYMVISHVLMAAMKRAAEGNVLDKALTLIPNFVYKTHPKWYENPYIEIYADEEEKLYLQAVQRNDEAGMRAYAENHR